MHSFSMESMVSCRFRQVYSNILSDTNFLHELAVSIFSLFFYWFFNLLLIVTFLSSNVLYISFAWEDSSPPLISP